MKLNFSSHILKIFHHNHNVEFARGHDSEQKILRIGPYFSDSLSYRPTHQYIQSRVSISYNCGSKASRVLTSLFNELIFELIRLNTPPIAIIRSLRSFRGVRSHQLIDRAKTKLVRALRTINCRHESSRLFRLIRTAEMTT